MQIGHCLRCHLCIDRRLHTAAESPQIAVLSEFKLPRICGDLQPVFLCVFCQIVFALGQCRFDRNAQVGFREIPRVVRCCTVCLIKADLYTLALGAAQHTQIATGAVL